MRLHKFYMRAPKFYMRSAIFYKRAPKFYLRKENLFEGEEINYMRGKKFYIFFYFLHISCNSVYMYAGLFFVQTDHHTSAGSPAPYKNNKVFSPIGTSPHFHPSHQRLCPLPLPVGLKEQLRRKRLEVRRVPIPVCAILIARFVIQCVSMRHT